MTATSSGEIGLARKRVEDPRLLQGQGLFTDDVRLPGTVDVAFVRSAWAHARLVEVDVSAARRAPGVLAVLTGEEIKDTPPTPLRVIIPEMLNTPRPPLAHGTVTAYGYPIVAVVATDRYLARDAAELVEVRYDPLPAVVDAEQAALPDAPLLYPELGTNRAFQVFYEGGDVDGEFARADHTLSLRLSHSRVAQVPMEPRAILASYDRERDFLTVWRSTQSPFGTRDALAAVLQRPAESIRVIAPDVGGAFGSKSPVYADELTAVLLAMRLGVPVRWISTRMEDLAMTMQGRHQVDLIDAAFRHDGIITALKTRTFCNFGAVSTPNTAIPPTRMRDYATGAYRIRAHRCELNGVWTNTTSTGPYRGAGRPEAAFAAERVAEEVARALALDPAEVRRRNFIQPSEFPWSTPNNAHYDSGDYERAMNRALELVDYPALRERQRQERADGAGETLLGIGIASTIEISAQGWESGSVEVDPDGIVTARTGSSSHGQGHDTSFCQVVADRLGVPFERVRLVHGDTAQTPFGIGTFGSRSMVLGGNALAVSADGVKARALGVASALLETAVEDLVFARGGVEVAGAPERRLELGDLAGAAERGVGLPEGEHGLKHQERFEPGRETIPFGTSVAVVRVDRESGRVSLERLVTVDDCGTIVNPMIVNGQIHGGLAQGIGQALYERIVFDDDGQLLTASLLDYAIPTAKMVPEYELDFTLTPSPNNPLGVKGVGESGAVSAPPAIVNAVLDALAPLGVRHIDMPLTAERVWRAIQDSEGNR